MVETGTFLAEQITTVGFPIVLCLIFICYLKYLIDEHRKEVATLNDTQRKEIAEITASHKEEMLSLKESLDNNTIVMTKLVERLGLDNE